MVIKERAPIARGARGRPPFTASSRGNNDRAVSAHEKAALETLTNDYRRKANPCPPPCNQLLLYKLVSGAEPLVTIAAMAPGSRPSDTIVAIVTRILTGATLRPIRVSLSDYQEVRSGERSLVLNHSELHCSPRTRTIGIVGQDARVLVVDDVVVSVLGRLAYGEEPVR